MSPPSGRRDALEAAIARLPFFSVVVVDHEESVPRDRFRRGLLSLASQQFLDFEVVLLHDGPKEVSYEVEMRGIRCPQLSQIVTTEKRHNDFGHSLRDMGIRLARGRYIVHFNADNVLYSHALDRIHGALVREQPPIASEGRVFNLDHIAVFAVLMRGMTCVGDRLVRFPGYEGEFGLILTGAPTRPNAIDCLQLVMKRSLWLEEGGWYDRSERSDGILYSRFVEKYGARYIPEVLGEHW